jgi:gas vesicle protein GvpO/gas vesicle protein GvpG
MFLIDDLLTAPGKAVLFVFQEMARKAQEEWLDDESVKRELQEIYNLLSNGKISEAEFEGRENQLLEQLEQIAKLKFLSKGGLDAMGTAATFHDPPAETASSLVPNEPIQIDDLLPAVKSQFDIASLTAPDLQDLTLSADVFEALRSLSHLVTSTPPVARADEQIIDSRQINCEQQTDVTPGPESSGGELGSAPLFISELEPHNSESSLSPMAAGVADPVPSPIQPIVEPVSSPPLPIQPQPTFVATAPAQVGAVSVPKTIQMSDAVDAALRTLAITKLRVSSIISAAKADDGWRVAVELVERAAVPDTGDLLGIYEVQLNQTGDVTRYERTRVRRRNDLR